MIDDDNCSRLGVYLCPFYDFWKEVEVYFVS